MPYRHARGITLIELLIVISIMMTVLSLVTPLTARIIDKTKAQSEYLQLCNRIKSISSEAFALSTPIRVTFSAKQVDVVREDTSETITFKYLSFDKQQLVFNSYGFPDASVVTVTQQHRIRQIDIMNLIGVASEASE